LAIGKKDTKRILKTINDWNKPRFTEQEKFCRVSLKINRKKVQEFAAVLSADLFRPLTAQLGENSSKPLVAMTASREKVGKVLHLAYTAENNIREIEDAATNEQLFGIQTRLREICSAVVEQSVSILNMEGTPFEIGK
jgi:hypothetical protein